VKEEHLGHLQYIIISIVTFLLEFVYMTCNMFHYLSRTIKKIKPKNYYILLTGLTYRVNSLLNPYPANVENKVSS